MNEVLMKVVKEFQESDYQIIEILEPEMCFLALCNRSGYQEHVVVDEDGGHTSYDLEGNQLN